MGDNLRREIDKGLAGCRFGVVILSERFFSKEWTQRELDGLTIRETSSGEKVILPVWHGLMARDVQRHSLTLAMRHAANMKDGLNVVADRITDVVFRERNRPDRDLVRELFAQLPAPPSLLAPRQPDYSNELRCPKCKNPAMHRGSGMYYCEHCPLTFPATAVAAA
jgi:TIR domain